MKWIPIDEKLPPKEEEVLATLTCVDDVCIIEYSPREEDPEFVYLYEGGVNGSLEDVLAWMPKPKPYKKERD